MSEGPAQAGASRLIQDLGNLPAIVGGLGLSIAEAQKELNKDFVDNIARLLEMIKETIGATPEASKTEAAEAIKKLLMALAPSRYQFTETTIEFYADIAERMQKDTSAGFSFGKTVMLTAGFSKSFGYDYRASARITSVLHAMPVGADLSKDLLEHADKMQQAKLALPKATELDKNLLDGVKNVHQALAPAKTGGGG